jgi:hypothetical protein
MSRARFADDELVTAVSTFSYGHSGVVRVGERFRGSDEAVRKFPEAFRRADTITDADLRAAAAAMQLPREDPHEEPRTRLPEPVAEELQVIAIRNVATGMTLPFRGRSGAFRSDGKSMSAQIGERRSRDDAIVKQNRDAFVEVNPEHLTRSEAVRCLASLREQFADGHTLVLHEGQWTRRGGRWTQRYPAHLFEGIS